MLTKNYTLAYDRTMNKTSIDNQTNLVLNKTGNRNKQSSELPTPSLPSEVSTTATANVTDSEAKSLNSNPTLNLAANYVIEKKAEPKSDAKKPIENYPHFHVTYWMFYPYSQGKIDKYLVANKTRRKLAFEFLFAVAPSFYSGIIKS